MDTANHLDIEYTYFRANLPQFIKEHSNKYVVIVGENTIGFYDTITDALIQTVKTHKLGTFFIELCIDYGDYNHIV